MDDKRGDMTVRQAGQKGGTSTAGKHGASFYREIGKRGGQARKGQLGTEGYAKLGLGMELGAYHSMSYEPRVAGDPWSSKREFSTEFGLLARWRTGTY